MVKIIPKDLAHHKQWQKCIPSGAWVLVIYKSAGLEVSYTSRKDEIKYRLHKAKAIFTVFRNVRFRLFSYGNVE